ncbi:MAG TPA: extracellular solute-binding protein [Thermomicrobiales bacterium]
MTDRDQRELPVRWFQDRLDRRQLLRRGAAGAAGLAMAGLGTAGAAAQATPTSGLQVQNAVEIEYWQYQFDSKVNLVNELIPEFQQQNPQITIKHVNFPYDDFQQQVAASVQAGGGPDVLNVYYGWVPVYAQQQLLIPLPPDIFPVAQIEADFFPMIQAAKIGETYYALPIAVRTLALFYNKDLLGAAGKQPPTTWEEFVDVAVATTQRDGDKLVTAGATYDPDGQGHHWWRECLNRQNGLIPMSEDKRTLHWSDPLGVEAFTWYMDLITKHKVSEKGFYTDGQTAFGGGHAALHVDGSFRLSTYASSAPDLNYGIVPLPAHKEQASFASFWANGITRNAAEGDKLIASAKFIDFLSSPDVMRRWTPAVGELPARTAIANEEAFTKDEKLAPFITSLPYSYATFFVNEADNRTAVLNAMDQVLLEGADPQTAVTEAQATVQKILDDYWAAQG